MLLAAEVVVEDYGGDRHDDDVLGQAHDGPSLGHDHPYLSHDGRHLSHDDPDLGHDDPFVSEAMFAERVAVVMIVVEMVTMVEK